MAQRIRGQEVQVFISATDNDFTFTDIRNFSVTPKFKKLEEQYLGETSNRYDELFDGVDFEMEMHLENEQAIQFASAIRERAADRTSKIDVTITALLQFAVGSPKAIVLQGCFFDNMPLNVGGRSEYVTFKVSGSCTNFELF